MGDDGCVKQEPGNEQEAEVVPSTGLLNDYKIEKKMVTVKRKWKARYNIPFVERKG
jgi:hypothetical protein